MSSHSMDKARSRWILCGFSLMLTSAYFDNLRGPLLPVLRRVFALSYGETSWFLVSGQLASVLFTFALIPLSRRFRATRLAFGTAVLGIGTAAAGRFVGGYFGLIALACCLGASISGLGAVANVLVIDGSTDENRSRFLCGVHTMYGLGSMVGPALCGALLSRGFPWHSLLLLNLPPLLLLAVFARFALPSIGQHGHSGPDYRDIEWTPRHILMLLIFAVYVAGEVLTSSWLTVYLVESRGFTVARAALYLGFFFLMMGITRASCFAWIQPRRERLVTWGCLLAGVLFFLGGREGWFFCFSLVGVLGPFFPLLMAKMSRELPTEAPTMALWILTVVYVTLSASHLTVGYLTDRIGIATTYWLPCFFLALTLVGLSFYFAAEGSRTANVLSRFRPNPGSDIDR